jgi:hypothetical protein
MSRHNTDLSTWTCTVCGHEVDDQDTTAMEEHFADNHPQEWALVLATLEFQGKSTAHPFADEENR